MLTRLEGKFNKDLIVRDVVLTINNYTAEDYAVFQMLKPFIQFYVIGFEVSKDRRTPHLQCFVQFKKKITLYAVKGFFKRAHIEVPYCDAETNFSYCRKDGCYEVHGTMIKSDMDLPAPLDIDLTK